MAKIFLGPESLLPPPIARCDVDVWNAIIDSSDLSVASDSPIYDWVQNIATAKGWPITYLEDSFSLLARRFPELLPYKNELLPKDPSVQSQTIWDWADRRLSNLPHESIASSAHCEQIGRWRLNANLTEAEQILLKCAVQDFASPALKDFYLFAATCNSERLFESIFGFSEPVFTEDWAIESNAQFAILIANWLRSKISSNDTNSIIRALNSRSSSSSKRGFGKVYAEAVENGLDPDPQIIAVLKPYLSGQHLRTVAAAFKPPSPGHVPSNPDELAAWFLNSYVPYRQWMHVRNISTDFEVAQSWSQFETSYLRVLSQCIGSGLGPLAMHRARSLKTSAESTLFIILDGPLPDDIQNLAQKLKANMNDWSICEFEWVLAAVPTITEVCRPTMTHGIVAAYVDDDGDVTRSLSKVPELISDGQRFVVVKLVQPDKAYEAMNATQEQILRSVRAQILMIADEIAFVTKSVDIDQIVISADHGRCWGAVDPVIDPCAGQIHRRTIMKVPKSAEVLSDGLARLDGELYGFDNQFDAAVALGATTFLGSNHLWYPHGGLLPEEAFVPWIVLKKVPSQISVKGSVHVEGILGREGTLTLRLQNSSEIGVFVESVIFSTSDATNNITFNRISVAPASSKEMQSAVPLILDNIGDTCLVRLSTPDGQQVEVQIPLTTEVRTFQKQNIDLLGDL